MHTVIDLPNLETITIGSDELTEHGCFEGCSHLYLEKLDRLHHINLGSNTFRNITELYLGNRLFLIVTRPSKFS